MPHREKSPLLHRRVDMSKGMESLDNAPPKPIARVVGRGEPVVGESGKLLLDVPVGSYNIRRSGGNWRKIYWDDLFHTIINTRTSRVIIGVFAAYSLVIFLFALCYRYVSVNDPTCNVGITTIMEAYIFSVETIMTIGYGAPSNDIFYGGCGSMAVILTLESFSGIFLDAVCIGMFFVRFSRATTRACSIIFTNFAVIRRIRGDYYFMFQVCERRKHQLAEAHVRCYAVRHEVSGEDGCTEEALFQTHHMRIQQPDDDIGAFLLMALPQVVVHRIDPWSPFFPRECLPDEYHATTCPAFPGNNVSTYVVVRPDDGACSPQIHRNEQSITRMGTGITTRTLWSQPNRRKRKLSVIYVDQNWKLSLSLKEPTAPLATPCRHASPIQHTTCHGTIRLPAA
ncbi:hypothetical protein, variant [Aphanomyces astaci]|uniref:Potassium channel inwardly rectifying transmembrane domain-containing protein n=1 Tax=Aphanomyces astaci TaxID=112090 RepID=W4FMS3_APHAT|nr:hypothetical protein, variant [Aphanomyces astaci]ETV68817.1 hypothetical protein, variant [Aphanomyces astaci]|eukprot:XP_009841771.1 hypothetical protein, variant [Aphanomyces astaci]